LEPGDYFAPVAKADIQNAQFMAAEELEAAAAPFISHLKSTRANSHQKFLLMVGPAVKISLVVHSATLERLALM
jgi:hypothetical protein